MSLAVTFHLSFFRCSSKLSSFLAHFLLLTYCFIYFPLVRFRLSSCFTAIYDSLYQSWLKFFPFRGFLLGIFLCLLSTLQKIKCHDPWHWSRLITLFLKLAFSHSNHAPLSAALYWVSNNDEEINYQAQNDHSGSRKADVVLDFRVILDWTEHDQVIRYDDKFAFIEDVHPRIKSIGSSRNVTCYDHEENAAHKDGK